MTWRYLKYTLSSSRCWVCRVLSKVISFSLEYDLREPYHHPCLLRRKAGIRTVEVIEPKKWWRRNSHSGLGSMPNRLPILSQQLAHKVNILIRRGNFLFQAISKTWIVTKPANSGGHPESNASLPWSGSAEVHSFPFSVSACLAMRPSNKGQLKSRCYLKGPSTCQVRAVLVSLHNFFSSTSKTVVYDAFSSKRQSSWALAHWLHSWRFLNCLRY